MKPDYEFSIGRREAFTIQVYRIAPTVGKLVLIENLTKNSLKSLEFEISPKDPEKEFDDFLNNENVEMIQNLIPVWLPSEVEPEHEIIEEELDGVEETI